MANSLKGDVLTIDKDSELYPASLLKLKNPPPKLYSIGNLDAFKLPQVCITGSKMAEIISLDKAYKFGYAIQEEGCALISSGQKGINEAAVKGALKAAEDLGVSPAITIVVPSNFQYIYPPSNTDLFQQVINQGGCVITAEKDNIEFEKVAFKDRDKIIACMSDFICAVQVGRPSGVFDLINHAKELGNKNIYALFLTKKERNSFDKWELERFAGAQQLVQEGANALYGGSSSFIAALNKSLSLNRTEELSCPRRGEVVLDLRRFVKDNHKLDHQEIIEVGKMLYLTGKSDDSKFLAMDGQKVSYEVVDSSWITLMTEESSMLLGAREFKTLCPEAFEEKPLFTVPKPQTKESQHFDLKSDISRHKNMSLPTQAHKQMSCIR